MEAIRVTASIMQHLGQYDKLTGHIHSVFEGAFNIIMEDEHLLGVLSVNKDLSPFGIQVNKDNFQSMGLEQGQEVNITNQQIQFSKRKYKIQLGGARHVSLQLTPLSTCNIEAFDEKLRQLKALILTQGSMAGIAPLIASIRFTPTLAYTRPYEGFNDYCEFIMDRLLELLEAIYSDNDDYMESALVKIIGFGPGLTPSADDFLSGLLSVLYVCGKMDIRLKTTVLKVIEGRTTKISEEMIHHTLKGMVSESYKGFITALFDESIRQIEDETMRVMQVGSTSGTDYLFGVYCMASLISMKEAYNDQI